MRLTRKIMASASFVVALCSSKGVAQTAFPLDLKTPIVVGESAELIQPIEASITRDGSLLLIDYADQKLMSFSAIGELQWRVGRKGAGPGEFQNLYRVAALADGSILTYDLSKAGFTRLTNDGKYRDVVRLDVTFHDIVSITGLRDGSIAIVGFVSGGARADTNAAIHVFDKEFRYVRSFAPLPVVQNRAVLRNWGAGSITLASDGSIVFTRRHPYEIYHYTPEGRELAVVRSTLPIIGSPDEAVIVSTKGSRTTMRANPNVTLFRSAIMLSDGTYLSGRMTPTSGTMDLFSSNGRLIGVRDAPKEWRGAMKFDAVRNLLWVFAVRDDLPVVLRYTLALKKNP